MSSLENMTFHDSYHPLSQIELFMQELVDGHPETARLINLGWSAEGRDILGLTISSGVDDDREEDIGGKKRRAEDEKRVWLRDPRRPTCKRGIFDPCPSNLLITNCITMDSDGYVSLYKSPASSKRI